MRIKNIPGEKDSPRIDAAAVENFFSKRAEKAKTIGALRAVIYQDKHPDLPERRDSAEKALLLPKLALQNQSRLIDIGCGTGRWTKVVAPLVKLYHGTDFAAGLIDIACKENGHLENVHYTIINSKFVKLDAIGESQGFDRILVIGLLMYLNEEDVIETLRRIAELADSECRLIIREPVAIDNRLTIKEHFSTDLDQFYNAIYRTESELLHLITETLSPSGFRLLDSGFVFDNAEMNNRIETVQKWYVLQK